MAENFSTCGSSWGTSKDGNGPKPLVTHLPKRPGQERRCQMSIPFYTSQNGPDPHDYIAEDKTAKLDVVQSPQMRLSDNMPVMERFE
ncbi:hypothetical protein CHS0354_001434 [Potamilus streckersoni]|uniref:Uncharacterized protein n=1 Tax=Potamilus streckersoni TaxID=2493646 RepID=A0AAE0W9R1_9BIVA|nr:hypothetical protein CHS0354_001434 [Potamilus streckersoni]